MELLEGAEKQEIKEQSKKKAPKKTKSVKPINEFNDFVIQSFSRRISPTLLEILLTQYSEDKILVYKAILSNIISSLGSFTIEEQKETLENLIKLIDLANGN